MGKILPDKRLDRVAFYENHVAAWLANAPGVGTTTAAVTSLTTLTATARAAYNAAQVLYDQAKAATQNYYEAVRAMDGAGSDMIKAIKAKAAAVGGTSVYALALLPVPATPTPIGAPGTPYAFAARLNPNGTLELTWQCANPAGATGTMYQVWRRTGGGSGGGGGGAFVAIGSCGTRKFTDTSVPAGVASVTYQIQAARSTALGTAAQFVVNFGTVEGGEMSATVVSAPKLAA